MKLLTSLREEAREKIEEIQKVDLLFGIPSYNNEKTIANVIETLGKGIKQYYPNYKSLIFVSDGGSTDDTRERASMATIPSYNLEKIVSIYRGESGKGSAVRAIFEAAHFLEAKVCVLCDADLRSITPVWASNLVEPVLHKYDFVTPYYIRYKYDATITNLIAYNLIRAIYKYNIRQPIGGDFAFSKKAIQVFLQKNEWDSSVVKYGIDIWLTITAIISNLRICQAQLGAKIHDAKDPIEGLRNMFRQVVHTLFYHIERDYHLWQNSKKRINTKIFGKSINTKPNSFDINLKELIEYFKIGYQNFSPLWKSIINKKSFSALNKAFNSNNDHFFIPITDWAKIVYDFVIAFHFWKRQRIKLIDTMLPLYYARIASLINETKNLNDEEFEAFIEKQAFIFEKQRPYLKELWNKRK